MLTSKDIEAAELDLGYTGDALDERLHIMQACLCDYYQDDDLFLLILRRKSNAKEYFAECWETLEDAAELFGRYCCLGFVPLGDAQRASVFESYVRDTLHNIDVDALELHAGRICELKS